MDYQYSEPALEEMFRTFHPTLAEQWRGAPQGKISKFIKRAKPLALPNSYLCFLERMGVDRASLWLTSSTADFSLRAVLSEKVSSDGLDRGGRTRWRCL